MEKAAVLMNQANALRANGEDLYDSAMSSVEDTDNKLSDLTADMIRIKVSAYVASAESTLAPQITAIAANLAQLAGLEEFESQVDTLKNSSAQIDDMIGSDERLAKDTQAIRDAANSIFEGIGYDPNASAEERLSALRSGRKQLSDSVTQLSKRPAVWLTGIFDVADSSQLQAVQESIPDAVNAAGRVITKVENGTVSDDGAAIAEAILTELFGGAPAAYDSFKTEFSAKYQLCSSKQEKRQYPRGSSWTSI